MPEDVKFDNSGLSLCVLREYHITSEKCIRPNVLFNK